MAEETYGYFWFRHGRDGTTFIACQNTEDGRWYMPGVAHPILASILEEQATLLGPVPRVVEGGTSIDN